MSDLLHGEVLVGFVVSLVAIAIHAVMMAVLVRTAYRTSHLTRAAHPQLRLIVLMWATVTVLMVAHLSEVLVWGAVYDLLGAVPHGVDSFYFAFVNYTTLGYGDLLLAPSWRLLGPLEATNGALMFGVSAAMVFAVIQRLVLARFEDLRH